MSLPLLLTSFMITAFHAVVAQNLSDFDWTSVGLARLFMESTFEALADWVLN